MKTNNSESELELNIDFIGEQDALTPKEEKALRDFFKKHKPIPKKEEENSTSKTDEAK